MAQPDELETVAEPRTASDGSTSEAVVGRTLGGDFVVRELIGSGGFGQVYLADQLSLGRQAVVKVLHGTFQDRADMVARFLREARLASRLDHPFAAHVYAFGAAPDGLLWLAMEQVRGTPLAALLEAGPIPLPRLLPFVERMCEVVFTAHEAGIVHRDLKADNVMVISRAGRLLPKLLDFGIAKLDTEPVLPPHAASSARAIGLTHEGQLMGSPQYMAPEQWRDPTQADARTDQYALAVVTYRALTGRFPLPGETLLELSQAHAGGRVQPLGEGFPAALDQVFARALAKRPEDRWGSVLDFAHAFRLASGLVEPGASLPQLDDAARESALATAPEPIADAVALLEASRSAFDALEATRRLARACSRWVATVALACRRRAGPGAQHDSPRVAALLGALRQGGLDEAAWLELVAALAAPFVNRRELYPVPELVDAVTAVDAEWRERAAALLGAVTPAARSEEHACELLARALAEAGPLLRSLAPLFAYRLVVASAGTWERWSGVRRAPRALETGIPGIADDRPALLDASGALALELWPLAQAMSPSPGAAREVFLLEGDGAHGARLLSHPLGFERCDAGLWQALELEVGPGSVAAAETAPYRGLEVFTAAHAANFFGRELEAEACANRVRVQPLLAVVGPSGSGKSSFVQAGVVPLLPASFGVHTLRPGRAPVAALEAGVEKLGSASTALLVVDQFEEVLTLCPDPGERLRFAQLLVRWLEHGNRKVVLTLRDDFLVRAQQLAPLKDLLAPGLQLLGTPAADQLRRIIEEPARRAGYTLDAGLCDDMVEAVAEQPGALALLSFTATRLWELRDRQDRRLTSKAYQSLGGVGGALGRHADDVLTALEGAEQQRAREVFRRLVTAEGTRAVMSRAELEQLSGAGADPGGLVDRLIAARLLISSEGSSGGDRIEVVHEALLDSWPRLVAWRREDAELARLRDQLAATARQWHQRGRERGLLWRGDALVELKLWASRYKGALTETEAAFARACLREDGRRRGAVRALVLAAFALLAAGTTLLYRSSREVEGRLARAYQEHGRERLVAGDALRALPYFAEAQRLGASGRGLDFMIDAAASALDLQEHVLGPFGRSVNNAAFSPDERWIAAASVDGQVKLFDARTGAPVRVLRASADRAGAVVFSPDGTTLASGHSDNRLRLWDVESGALRFELDPGDGPTGYRWDPRGARLLVGGWHGSLLLYDAATGALLRKFEGHPTQIHSVAWSADGRRVLSRGSDPFVSLWDVETGARLARLEHGAPLRVATFTPGGELVTAAADGAIRVWRADDGAPVKTLVDPLGIAAGLVDPSGERLAAASLGGSVRIWNLRAGLAERVLRSPSEKPQAIAFERESRAVLVAGDDGRARVWELPSGRVLADLQGHFGTVWSAAFSRAGDRVLTASNDGTARTWRLPPRPADLLLGPKGGTGALRPSPDQRWLLAVGGPSPKERTAVALEWQRGTADERVDLEYGGAAPAWLDSERFVAHNEGVLEVWRPGHGREWTLPTSIGKWATQIVARRGTVVVGSGLGPVLVFDAERRVERERFDAGAEVTALALDEEAARLAAISADRVLHVWRLHDGATLLTAPLQGIAFFDLTFDPKGERLAAADESGLGVVLDAATGRRLAVLDGASGLMRSIQFSRDGALLLTANRDGYARLWSADDGRMLLQMRPTEEQLVAATFASGDTEVVTYDTEGRIATSRLPEAKGRARDLADALCRTPFVAQGEALVTRGFAGCGPR